MCSVVREVICEIVVGGETEATAKLPFFNGVGRKIAVLFRPEIALNFDAPAIGVSSNSGIQ